MDKTTLMRLRRVAGASAMVGGGIRTSEAFISRTAGGLDIDFVPGDPTAYMVATEDGHVHRCSTAYNEQYLETYVGHTAPVYSVSCSPYMSDICLSSSADWTSKLWRRGSTGPILSCLSSSSPVADSKWCPTNSCIFASASSDGRCDLWDLSVSTLDPATTVYVPETELTCLQFSETYPTLAVGGSDGSVMLYRLINIPERGRDALIKTLSAV
eukprot:TRINITY_DN17614_c0_g1_i1.p1 TRINITY_DN17614_c0_g1~~TRINITY_DN17614_c0_g1_i1.p1  ORF type:complete len:213 (-),score=20.38 TRINITY_DN17614_c0_g1_i1:51-689(-)